MHITSGIHPVPADPGSLIQNLVSFTPGRVNLIGEHTDYNGGMVMPAALELGLRCELKILNSNHGQVICASRSCNETVEFDAAEISEFAHKILESGIERSDRILLPGVTEGHWTRYVAGCLSMFEASLKIRQIQKIPWHEKTISIVLESSLPQGAGLSSSAALCISLLGQLNFLAGAPLDANSIARLAMLVEHRFAGTHCGLMDQLAVLCSRADHFTRVDFLEFPVSKSFHISYAKAHHVFHNHAIVIFKTGVNHSLAESAYNERRFECETALRGLNKALGLGAHSLGELSRLPRFQEIVSESEYQKTMKSLLEQLPNNDKLASRATHAMLENNRVIVASKALASGNFQALDTAMKASHSSLDQLYEVSCAELNLACQSMTQVIAELRSKHAKIGDFPLIGPRMTGGGFGGSTVQLVHQRLCDELLERFSQPDNPYTRKTGIIPELFLSRPSSGFAIGMETIS